MSKQLMIAGNTGSGKSTSLRNLDPKSTFVINCGKKDFSFPKARVNYTQFDKATLTGNVYNTDNFNQIINIISFIGTKMSHIKTLVIDDFQFSMAASVMNNINIKGFEKWNELAAGIWNTLGAGNSQREDLTVVFIEHLESDYDDSGVKQTKAKTVGKLIDKTVNLDGLFTTILYSEAIKNAEGRIDYVFRTHTNGTDTCKTPMGMFEDDYIPNDLAVVIDKMKEYYGDDILVVK